MTTASQNFSLNSKGGSNLSFLVPFMWARKNDRLIHINSRRQLLFSPPVKNQWDNETKSID